MSWRKKVKDNVNYRELAHKQLDEWIDDTTGEAPGLMLAYGYTKDNPSNLWLGPLAKTMVKARAQASRQEHEKKLTEEEKLFQMVYQWGRVGIVVDASAPAFQDQLNKVKKNRANQPT